MTTRTRPARYRVNADSWTVLRDILKEFKPFNRETDTFHGEIIRPDSDLTFGKLPQMWRDHLTDLHKRGELDYVAYSYRTPIAWVGKVDGLIQWVCPDVRYSQTTSKHMCRLRPAIYS